MHANKRTARTIEFGYPGKWRPAHLVRALALAAVLAAVAFFPAAATAATLVLSANFNSDTVGLPPSTNPAGPPDGDSLSLTTPGSSSILVAPPGTAFATNSVEFTRVAQIGGSPILRATPSGAPFTAGLYHVSWLSAAEQATSNFGFAAIVDTNNYGILTVNYNGGQIVYQDGAGVQYPNPNVAVNTFEPHRFDVYVDLTARTFDLIIDGVTIGNDRQFQFSNNTGLGAFVFEIGGTDAEAYLVDDIAIEDITAAPAIAGLALSVDEAETGAGAYAVPINDIPVQSIPLRSTAVEGAPLRSTPLRSTPLRSTPLRSTGLAALPLDYILLSSVPILSEGGWSAVLAGTPLQGVPLQSITLEDVFDLSPLPEKIDPPAGSSVEPLALGDIDLSSTPLRSTRLVSIALGPTVLADITLPPPNADPQTDWCNLLSSLGTSCAALGVNVNTTSLLALDLAGVRIQDIPFGQIAVSNMDLAAAPLRSTPLRSTLIAATPLRSTPISALADPGQVVNCDPLIIDCATATLLDAEQAGAILASATLGTLLDNLPASVLGDLTLGELLIGFLGRSDYPWEELPLEEMGVQDFAGLEQTLHYHLTFSNTGNDSLGGWVASVQLPEGFRYVPGSSWLELTGADAAFSSEIPDATVNGSTLEWSPDYNVGAGSSAVLSFQARPGLRLGLFSSSAAISAGNLTASAQNQAPVRVVEQFEPPESPDDPATAPVAAPDVLYISHITGDADFYRIAVPEEPGSRISVFLSHQSSDNDLIMYGPSASPLRSTPLRSTPLRSTPLRSTPVEDQGLDTTNTGGALPPETLQDIALQALPLRSTSTNRSTANEGVEAVSLASETGFYTVQVSGYNGAISNDPYVLRVKVTSPGSLPPCSPRAFGFAGQGSAGSLPVSLAPDTNTLILVNQKQFGELYGATAAGEVMTALASLAAQPGPGVRGAVIPVEGDPAVAAAYDAWNLNPCSAALANDVVSGINFLIDDLRASLPGLRYIVLAGSDEAVPMARIPDTTQIANEAEYMQDLEFAGNNALFGSMASENFLSDDPYGDFDPIPWLDRALFVPDVAVGRLVETPAEIVGAVTRFTAAGGVLDLSTAKSLTTAYDFLADGGVGVDAALEAILGTGNTSQLINETWTRQDLVDAFTGAADPPDIASVNAHYDHYRALPAAGNTSGDTSDLFTTADVGTPLPGRVLFSMGCHAGLNVPDVLIGAPTAEETPKLRDWAQTYADRGAAAFVANTGFGYGDSAAVALSEKLMLLFSERLNGSMSAGEALTFAKQEYFAGKGLYGVYDEKVLEESVFYGLPMYQLNVPGATPAAAAVSLSTAAAASYVDPATGLEAADIHAEPSFTLATQPDGSYYHVAGKTQAIHYRPVEPLTETDVTLPGKSAHGALITGLSSTDNPNFNPVFSRPTIDLAAHEPEPDFGDVIFPTAFQSISTFNSPDGEHQRLVLIPGQFQATGVSGDEVIGNQRLLTSIDAQVLYSNSTDFTSPTISEVDAKVVGPVASFAVEAADNSPATVKRVLVLFRDITGAWTALDLTQTPGTLRWTGGAPATGEHVEVIVQAVDDAGNVGIFANKGDPLPVLPPPPPTPGGLTMDVAGPAGEAGWFTGDVTVTVTGPDGVVFDVSVDGGMFAPYAGPLAVSGEGIHEVTARGSNGAEGTITVPIDTGPPQITLTVPANNASYLLGEVVLADYSCSDSGAGVTSCTGTAANGGSIDTATVGSKTFTVSAVDGAGHTVSLTHTYTVGYSFAGFFAPVDNLPVLNVAKAGNGIPVKWRLLDSSGQPVRDLGAIASIASQRTACSTSAAEDVLETVVSGSSAGLRYDAATEQFIFNWQSYKSWAGTCRRLQVMLADGTYHEANFKFK